MKENLKYLIYFYWCTLIIVFGYAVFIQGRSFLWFFVMLLISHPLSEHKE